MAEMFIHWNTNLSSQLILEFVRSRQLSFLPTQYFSYSTKVFKNHLSSVNYRHPFKNIAATDSEYQWVFKLKILLLWVVQFMPKCIYFVINEPRHWIKNFSRSDNIVFEILHMLMYYSMDWYLKNFFSLKEHL